MDERGESGLSQEQVERFRLDGYLVVPGVFTREEMEVLAHHSDRIARGEVTGIPASSIQLEQQFREGTTAVSDAAMAARKLFQVAVYDSIMWAHVTHPRLVRLVQDLMGTPDLKLYNDQLFMKPAQVGSEQPWHQDSGSWRDIFPMDLVTAWTAIDDATVDNGCLNFAPGSHRGGMMRGSQVVPLVQDITAGRWPKVAAPVASGGVSFHHSLVLHQSNANTSGTRRRGYAAHYMRATSWRDPQVTGAPRVPTFKQVSGRSYPGRV